MDLWPSPGVGQGDAGSTRGVGILCTAHCTVLATLPAGWEGRVCQEELHQSCYRSVWYGHYRGWGAEALLCAQHRVLSQGGVPGGECGQDSGW